MSDPAAGLVSGQPSRTSILVAAARAVGARDPDEKVRNPDHLAERLLGRAGRGSRQGAQHGVDVRHFRQPFAVGQEITDSAGFLRQLINQYGYELDTFNGLPGVPVPADTATLGTTEVWSLINTTVDVHPIHLHQTMFKVLSRQPFSVSQYQAKRVHGVPLDPTPFLKQDMLQGPAPNESGWKDTVKANPGEVTRIAMRWEDYTGHYVYHCHILEHEEHDMMRALDVLPAV